MKYVFAGSHLEHNLSDFDSNLHIFLIQALDTLTPQIRQSCLHYLHRICGHQALLPRSLTISLFYDPTENPLLRGGLTDMWKGQYFGQEVAVQVLRVYRHSDHERIRRVSHWWGSQLVICINNCILQKFCREVVTWKALCHPNVLPLLGVTITETQFMMASEWMENGNINDFVKADTDVDQLGLVCFHST